ncbi:TPA: spore germination protein [Bacillus cereus]
MSRLSLKRFIYLSEIDSISSEVTNKYEGCVSNSLVENVERLKNTFPHAPDLVIRKIKKHNDTEYTLIYLSELSDKDIIQNNILQPLIKQINSPLNDINVNISEISLVEKWSEVQSAILEGDSILFISDKPYAYQLGTKGWPQRDTSNPQNEISIKGAHQGFVETAAKNIAMIRRYVPNKNLIIKSIKIGAKENTNLYILYIEDLINPELLIELNSKLNKIEIDCLINAGELTKYLENSPLSPFPQLLLTERPDFASAQIMKGRFLIVVDRSPNVLIGPTNFTLFFQSNDDTSTKKIISFFIKMLRIAAFFLALLLPAFYIALISFNFSLIPVPLFLSIAESRENVPFSAIIEALIMEITLEMMREASLRLPSPISQTMGIVGGIIIGQAAVQAGIVSNIMIIVVSITAIASFTIPNYDMSLSVRYLRFPMMLLASLFGIVGMAIGLMSLFAHIISINSFGTTYGDLFYDFKNIQLKKFVREVLRKYKKS